MENKKTELRKIYLLTLLLCVYTLSKRYIYTATRKRFVFFYPLILDNSAKKFEVAKK